MKYENENSMKVFISYARQDFSIAEKIYDELKNRNISPWMDKKDLLPGQDWKMVIRTEIRSANFFILLLSSNSVTKRGFVQKEMKIALDIFDEYPKSDIFIIPIRLDDCSPTDDRLVDLHWVDIFPSFENGIKQIMRVFSKYETKNDNNQKHPLKIEKKINYSYLIIFIYTIAVLISIFVILQKQYLRKFVILITRVPSIQFTQTSLDEMEKLGLPKHHVDALKPLLAKTYTSEDELLDDIEKKIGINATSWNRDIILDYINVIHKDTFADDDDDNPIISHNHFVVILKMVLISVALFSLCMIILEIRKNQKEKREKKG